MINNDLDLKKIGITQSTRIKRNLPVERIVEDIVLNKEGKIGLNGAVMVDTGQFTGRSPLDRFIVKDKLTEETVWWGTINIPFDCNKFDSLHKKISNYLNI